MTEAQDLHRWRLQYPTARRYTYRIAWSEQDLGYVATCLEFPSLSCTRPLIGDALYGCIAYVARAIDDLVHRGGTPPEIGSIGEARRAETIVDTGERP